MKKASDGKYKNNLSVLKSVSVSAPAFVLQGSSSGCQAGWCLGREYVSATFIKSISDKNERDVFISYTLLQTYTNFETYM